MKKRRSLKARKDSLSWVTQLELALIAEAMCTKDLDESAYYWSRAIFRLTGRCTDEH